MDLKGVLSNLPELLGAFPPDLLQNFTSGDSRQARVTARRSRFRQVPRMEPSELVKQVAGSSPPGVGSAVVWQALRSVRCGPGRDRRNRLELLDGRPHRITAKST